MECQLFRRLSPPSTLTGTRRRNCRPSFLRRGGKRSFWLRLEPTLAPRPSHYRRAARQRPWLDGRYPRRTMSSCLFVLEEYHADRVLDGMNGTGTRACLLFNRIDGVRREHREGSEAWDRTSGFMGILNSRGTRNYLRTCTETEYGRGPGMATKAWQGVSEWSCRKRYT